MSFRIQILFLIAILSIKTTAFAQSACIDLFKSVQLPSVKIVLEQLPKLLSTLDPVTLKYLTEGEIAVESFGDYEIRADNLEIESNLVLKKNFSLSVYKNDIYLSKYYFYRFKKSGLSMSEFTKNQPWFKWDCVRGQYTLERMNATENIVQNLFGNEEIVTLYRGTYASEKEYMKTIQNMNEYDAIESIKTRLQGKFGAYFFTPSKSSAEAWVKGDNGLVEVNIPKSLFLKWVKDNAIYAGVENPYFEFAFFDPHVIKQLAEYYH